MNYFEYQDFPKIDRSKVVITTNLELQTGSSVEQLKDGVRPYDYASFEKDAYITTQPKKLASKTNEFGLLSSKVTDANGYGTGTILIDLGNTFSFSGVTLEMLNLLQTVTIKYYDNDNNYVRGKTFVPVEKFSFFSLTAEGVRYVEVKLTGTKNPYSFIGVNRIDLGKVRIFDASVLVDANVITHFDVDGSTIQYDVAELTIFTGENSSDYLFQKKQPIVYKDVNGKTLHKFYIESGENNDDATANLTAYDSISLLEDEYLGGIYGFTVSNVVEAPTITYQSLVEDILKDTGVEYEVAESIKDTLVTGYIPICTRRQALMRLCKGTNTRVFKLGGKIYLKPIEESLNVIYNKNQVAENPSVTSGNKIGKLTVIEHKYLKGTEPVDLYNWYLRQSLDGQDTMQLIKFDRPIYKISAYEVTGTDENGFDIIDTSSGGSKNVTFYHAPIQGGYEEGDDNVCNYCIIKSCNTANKVLIRGWEILDDANDNTYYQRTDIDVNAEYEEIVVEDVTLTAVNDGVKQVAKTLFAIENQRQTEEFMIVETDRPNVGESVSTPMIAIPISMDAYDKDKNRKDINYRLKITEVEDNLSGVYRVVAK